MKTIVIMFLLFAHTVSAQVKVNEIRMKFGSEFHKAKDPDVVFPAISTGNKEIDGKINLAMIKEITAEDSTADISKTLFRAMNEGLSELSYKITLNTKDIFSVRIYTFGCGAYCSAYYYPFNFDLHTGDLLKIEDVIDSRYLDSFRTVVLKDKRKALQLDMKEKDSLLSSGAIDTADYDLMLERIRECSEEANINRFLLFKDELHVIDDCEFPHVITGMQPVYQLKFRYKKIKRFISPSFLLTFNF